MPWWDLFATEVAEINNISARAITTSQQTIADLAKLQTQLDELQELADDIEVTVNARN